jgi:C1q domain
MKKGIIILLILSGFFYNALAQKPITDPSGKTKVDPDQLKPLPPPPVKVAFSAVISRPRQILFTYDQNLLKNFDQINFNDGNGFDAPTGLFTTPATGYYCFIFNISYTNYGCSGSPVTFNITIVKNNEEIQTFRLPVSYGAGQSSEGFTALIQLNKGDKLELKPLAAFCTQSGSNRPSVNKIIFSGYKIN